MNTHVTTLPRDALPCTIKRLRALKVGQELIYYTGNFEADIRRSQPLGNGSPDRGAPTYAALLSEIRNEAQRLEATGKIRLSERPISRGRDLRMIEYTAVGLRG